VAASTLTSSTIQTLWVWVGLVSWVPWQAPGSSFPLPPPNSPWAHTDGRPLVGGEVGFLCFCL
jgi:hypothetical protein